MRIDTPYLIFLGDAPDQLAAKTGLGVHYWRPDACLGQHRLAACKATLGLPELSLAEGRERGARTLLIGVANRGGVVPDAWQQTLIQALELGLDIASGLHTQLSGLPAVADAAARHGRRLHDVRHPKGACPIATGKARAGNRVLTVGTDCSVGKMYTSLAVERELRQRGISVAFRATGQTGILIAGSGISVDGVIADFISGAAEQLCPAADDPTHWDSVEGQGSLFHPSFAGVSLGLLHGAQPTALILCHEPTRTHMRGLPQQPMPALDDCIAANLEAARLVSPEVRLAGCSINTSALSADDAQAYLAATEHSLGCPCVDPLRTGVTGIVDLLL